VDEAIVTPFSARLWLRIAAISLALVSATPGQAEAETYTPVEFWNTQILDGIRQGHGSTPTMSSYDAATLDVAIYNAVNAASGLPGQPSAGTPAPVVAKLNTALRAAMARPELTRQRVSPCR
jgi:hypothetical protein